MTRCRIARVGEADSVDFFSWTTIQVEHFNVDTCRPYDRIKERLNAHMFDLHGVRIDFGGTILVDRTVDDVWLISIWIGSHPCACNQLCPYQRIFQDP